MTESPSSRWNPWDILLVVFVLSGSVWLARLPFRPPDPVGMEAPDTTYSAARATEHLQVIARAPHLPGSQEHEVVRRYLFRQLETLGFEAEYQGTTSIRGSTDTRAIWVWNVVGRLEGTDPTGAVLLMAHYDPVPMSSGANDDGTGVSAILETLRALRAGPPLRNDLIVLFSDGEELGLMGARAFVDRHRWFPEVSVVLNLEVKGDAGAVWMFETGPENGWIIRAFAEADPRPLSNSMSLDVYRNMPNDTDYSPFRDAGIQGLNFSSVASPHTYHLAMDNLAHMSPPTIQHHGLHALALARYLGHADLAETHGPDVAFTSLPLLKMVLYPPWFHWVALLLSVVLAVGTLLLGIRRQEIRTTAVVMGLGVGIGALVVSGALAPLLIDLVEGFHPEYGRLHGSRFHAEGWYYLAVMAVTVGVVLGLVGLTRRRFGLAGLAWGGALIPLFAAIALAMYMPLAALNLVWPVLFGQIGFLWYLLRLHDPPASQRERAIHLVVLGIILLPVTVLLVPMTETLWVAMSISQSSALAILATLTLLLLLPILAPFFGSRPWKAPALAGVLGILFMGLGIAGSQPTPEGPTPVPLFYQMDREAGLAWWATSDGTDDPWIRERVPSTEGRDGEEIFFPRGYLTEPADPVDVPEPEIVVVQDSLSRGGRVVRLAITSRIGAEVLDLRPGEGVEAVLLGVNEASIRQPGGGGGAGTGPDPESTGFPLRHWGDPGGPVEVEVLFPADTDTAELLLMERAWRPERFLGEEPFRRPPQLIPAIRGTSDVAIFGTRIRLPT